MRNIEVVIGLMVIFLSLPVFAITLSEPANYYNLGDKIYINVSGVVGSPSGNLNIDLVCSNKTVNLVKIPARSFLESEQTYSVPYKILNKNDLEIGNLDNVLGVCHIEASLGSSETSSKNFEISNKILLTANLNKTSYDPGEEIIVNINANKMNGESFNGIVEASNATSFTKGIDGTLTQSFSMDEDTEAGYYNLNFVVYDKDNGDFLNNGSAFVSFSINQVARSAVLSLSSLEVEPEKNFDVGVSIFDQSGKQMEGTAKVKIVSYLGEEISLDVASGQTSSFSFPVNATAGTWEAILSFNSLSDKREFEVLQVAKVKFEFDGPVLVITNIGNGPYNKSVSIKIGDQEKSLDVMLGIGESKRYNLNAPNGEYPIAVNDGESSIDQVVYLTGKSISVKDFKSGKIFSDYLFIWIFFILILAGAGITLYFKSYKTRTIGKEGLFGRIFGRFKHNNLSQERVYTPQKKEKGVVDLTDKNRVSAESALVLSGVKHKSSVISIAIKNYNGLSSSSKNSLTGIIKNNCNKGLIDYKDDHVFLIFSPVITKTFENESLASKSSFSIFKELKEYNKKFNEKIKFNIGVHSGDLVTAREKDRLKYTNIGNTVSLSKRMSDLDEGKLLVSDSVRRKLMRDLKVEKYKEIGTTQIYSVYDVKDKEADSERLKEILKRRNK